MLQSTRRIDLGNFVQRKGLDNDQSLSKMKPIQLTIQHCNSAALTSVIIQPAEGAECTYTIADACDIHTHRYFPRTARHRISGRTKGPYIYRKYPDPDEGFKGPPDGWGTGHLCPPCMSLERDRKPHQEIWCKEGRCSECYTGKTS